MTKQAVLHVLCHLGGNNEHRHDFVDDWFSERAMHFMRLSDCAVIGSITDKLAVAHKSRDGCSKANKVKSCRFKLKAIIFPTLKGRQWLREQSLEDPVQLT
jgi:hypothetical protein